MVNLNVGNDLYHYRGNNNRAGAYVPNGLNQYTSVGGMSLSYDANGNLTNDGTATTYTYDEENRLLGTSSPSSSFQYDPLGRLFSATLGGVTTQFLYDGDALVAEYVNGSLTRRYEHGDRVDEPWVQYEGIAVNSSLRRFLHEDHQGSVVALSNSGGTAVNKLSYDVYGIPNDNNAGRFGYTGQTWMKEIGLFHYKARFYHPKLGRFLQTDPVFYEDQMNMYAYVGNDPVNKVDPTGMYGQGSGWTDAQWKKFDKAQQRAANKMESRAEKLEKAAGTLASGGKLGFFQKLSLGGFGKIAGKFSVEGLNKAAGSLRSGAEALRSDGSDGRVANAVDSSAYQGLGGSANGAAFVVGNGPIMVVNTGNSAGMSDLSRVVGHESLHTAGLHDIEGSNGKDAYKYGLPANKDSYRELMGTDKALENPDHLMDLVY